MDKKDILEKAQLEYTDSGDEMELEEEGSDGIIQLITFLIMGIVFMAVRLAAGLPVFDYIATIFYAIGTISIIRFRKLKQMKYIVISVISIALALAATFMFARAYSLI